MSETKRIKIKVGEWEIKESPHPTLRVGQFYVMKPRRNDILCDYLHHDGTIYRACRDSGWFKSIDDAKAAIAKIRSTQ